MEEAGYNIYNIKETFVYGNRISRICSFVLIFFLVLVSFVFNSSVIFAIPVGPSVVSVHNETATPQGATKINTSGGSITTVVLNATTQNLRWKAYVGNVSGKLTLDDSSGFTVFDWSLMTVEGEVYATRSSSTPSWADIGCATWDNITNEEIALNHTSNPNDNISATFDKKQHSSFYVGSVSIGSNTCYSLHTNVNGSNQSIYFEEVLLHDKENMIYATILENDVFGYNNQTYDFQMIVPEVGLDSWSSSTAYYFYVELS